MIMEELVAGVLSGLLVGTCVTYPLVLWLARNLRGGALPPPRRERRARAELEAFFGREEARPLPEEA
ncbi:hypothetical protein GKQ77_17895 [Streptomyces sp. BG9H]|uniref:Uncharacterized protein n=1 Tax=Streptomyces anatolicus TaxID=2675858 RepID=A0ABS6YPU5_9ACTN|nr:hypothetical protein [Streptomyces anatolicus]MBW5423418.1 hypothetical protein [Streptomyces anatolicus]